MSTCITPDIKGYFSAITERKYFSGGYGENNNQEDDLRELRVLYGLRDVVIPPVEGTSKARSNSDRIEWMKQNLRFGDNVCQPFGANNAPDHIIMSDDGFIEVELKSIMKGGRPVLNGRLPSPNWVYVISSGQYNQTTICRGSDIVKDSDRSIASEWAAESRALDSKYNVKLEANDANFRVYNRAMYNLTGINLFDSQSVERNTRIIESMPGTKPTTFDMSSFLEAVKLT